MAPDGDPVAVPASDEIRGAISSRCKQKLKTPPRRLNKRRNTSTLCIRSDAANASSDDLTVIDLESDHVSFREH